MHELRQERRLLQLKDRHGSVRPVSQQLLPNQLVFSRRFVLIKLSIATREGLRVKPTELPGLSSGKKRGGLADLQKRLWHKWRSKRTKILLRCDKSLAKFFFALNPSIGVLTEC